MSRPRCLAVRSCFMCFALMTALCCGLWTGAAGAQTAAKPAPSASPVPLDAAPPIYPEVQADGTAVFRLAMPNAVKVELHLEGVKEPFPMTRGSDGAWSVTVPKIAPQYYSYFFKVDGTNVLDPHNVSIKTSFFSDQNIFLVPGRPPMPWEPADVPHGVVHHHYYHSNIVGINSEYYVYTPPGFDPEASRNIPFSTCCMDTATIPAHGRRWERPMPSSIT